jgi:hypothetical protein
MREKRNARRVFVWKTLEKKCNLQVRGKDTRIILKWVLWK